MDYDLEIGFVLRRKNAMEYLDKIAQEHVTNIMNNEEDIEGIKEILDDLHAMKRDIANGEYEYIKFVECPMAASNINIIPMVEKE